MPSNVLVSGVVEPARINGLYILSPDQVAGKNAYYSEYGYILWNVTYWILEDGEFGTVGTGSGDVEYPWLATWESPLVITEVPTQNTHGLPADVVALITSRFGSVDNFLRLRNLGYI